MGVSGRCGVPIFWLSGPPAMAISAMRRVSASDSPNVGCAVKTMPVRARSQRALKAEKSLPLAVCWT